MRSPVTPARAEVPSPARSKGRRDGAPVCPGSDCRQTKRPESATRLRPAAGGAGSAGVDSPAASKRQVGDRVSLECRAGGAGSAGVDGSAALQGPAQGELVGVFEVAADRQAAGDPGEADAVGGQVAGHEGGRGLALEVGVGGD